LRGGGRGRGASTAKKKTPNATFCRSHLSTRPRPQEARKQIGDVANKATAQLKTVADAMGTKPAS